MTGKEINCYRTGMTMLWLGYTGSFLTWVVKIFLPLLALFAEEHIVKVVPDLMESHGHKLLNAVSLLWV